MHPFSRLASTGLDFPWGARLGNLLLLFLSWPTRGCPGCGELRRGSCTPLFHSWPQLIDTHPGEIGCRSCVPSSMVGLPQVSHTLGCQTMDAVPHLPWLTCTSSSINGQPSLCKSMEAEPPIPYCPPPQQLVRPGNCSSLQWLASPGQDSWGGPGWGICSSSFPRGFPKASHVLGSQTRKLCSPLP